VIELEKSIATTINLAKQLKTKELRINMNSTQHELVKTRPAAKFFYKGTHSHPVKRTVLITEQEKEYFKGYEVREGGTVRDIEEAPIKSFRIDKIAMTNELRSDNPLRTKVANPTLERMSLSQLEKNGI